MPLTDDIWLPSEEELKHKEIPLTYNYLLTSAMWLGKYCDTKCKDFMLCRNEELDPRKCLKEGQEVTDCGLEFFKKVKKTCRAELEWYNACMDYSGSDPEYQRCRDAQAIFDGCMYDSGFERAKFGHFQMVRVHDPERPKPKRNVPLFEDAVESHDIYKPEITATKPVGGLGGRYRWRVWNE